MAIKTAGNGDYLRVGAQQDGYGVLVKAVRVETPLTIEDAAGTAGDSSGLQGDEVEADAFGPMICRCDSRCPHCDVVWWYTVQF